MDMSALPNVSELQKFVHLREDVTPASSDRLILVRVGHFFVLSIGVVRNVWVMEIYVPFAASGPWSFLLAAIDAIYWSTCQCDFDPCSRDDCRARYAFNPSRPGHDAKH